MTEEQKEKRKQRDRRYREKNKEKIAERTRNMTEEQKEKRKQYMKEYVEKNKDKLKEKWKEYAEINADSVRECKKKCKQKRLEYYKAKQKEYQSRPEAKEKRNKMLREKRKQTREKLNISIGNGMRFSLSRKLVSKDGRKWQEIVGYTVEDLMNHLESLFKEGMTWDNYGTYWHIDHIRPKSWFVFESIDDPAFKECWALSNLQPLEASVNISKGNRYEG